MREMTARVARVHGEHKRGSRVRVAGGGITRWVPHRGRVRGTSRRPDGESLEIEVLTVVGRGLTGPGIGWRLAISEATVKTHLVRVFAKLGVTDRTSAVTEAPLRG